MKTRPNILLLSCLVIAICSLPLLTGGCSDNHEATVTAPDAGDAAKATQRSFDEFLAAQGTFCWPDGEGGCFDFDPPTPNITVWYDPSAELSYGWFDYGGVADAWLQEASDGAMSLGTEITGKVTERPLADGRAVLKVNLHAKNTMAYIMTDFQAPLIFGYRADEVLAGAPPALGSVNMNLECIIAAPGAPLPDLVQIMFWPGEGEELVRLTFSASATGEFREASGYPEGTLGRTHCIQVDLSHVDPGNPNWDGYPVENLTWWPIGDGDHEYLID